MENSTATWPAVTEMFQQKTENQMDSLVLLERSGNHGSIMNCHLEPKKRRHLYFGSTWKNAIILFTGKCQLVHSKGVPLYFHLSRQTTWCHLAEPQSQAVMSLYFAEETCHFKWMIDGAFLHSNKNELWALDWTNHLLSFHLIFAFNFQTRSYWKF